MPMMLRKGLRMPMMLLLLAVSALDQRATGEAEKAAVAWLRDHSIDLALTGSAADPVLPAIDRMTGSARVIAMGEPTHGTHEFLRLRNRIFESLVARGVTAIALETGFQDALAVDAYLQSPGIDPPSDAIARAMVAYSNDAEGNGRTENRELLRWIHEYNTAHPGRRVHLYGFDLSGRSARGGFLNAAKTITAALAYVDRVDPVEARRLVDRLGSRLRAFQSRSYAKKDKDYDRLSAKDRALVSDVIRDLATDFQKHASAWRAATSPDEYWTAAELSTAAVQLDGFFQVNFGQGGMPPDATAYRDHAMAANVISIVEHVTPGRLFVFAHDVHVEAGGEQVNSGPGKSMGSWLRAELGGSLFVLGGIDGLRHVGDTIAATVMADDASVPGLCAAVGRPAFVANLHELPEAGPVHDWFSQRRAVNPVAFPQTASYTIVVPRWYDAIVFVRDVHIATNE